MTSSVKSRGCGEVNRTRSRPSIVSAGAQQLAERLAVADVGAVRVHVLAEQGDLGDALGDQRLDLGEDVARAAVLLLAAQRRDDAERAGVVAADGDGDPRGVRGLAPGRQGGGEGLERLGDLDLGLFLDPGALQQHRQLPMLWVPKTTSTQGAFLTMVSRSFWARHPPTAICMPGRRAFIGASRPRLP